MLNQPTVDKLRALRLEGMCNAWIEQQSTPANTALSFDERLALLVDAEASRQQAHDANTEGSEAALRASDERGGRLPGKARAGQSCSAAARGRSLGEGTPGDRDHRHDGDGKSFLACAFAHQACRQGYRALYRRAPRLFDELKLARADGTYQRVLTRIARFDVLFIDDFAISPISDAERRDLLEVLEDRQERRSTIITSQLDPKHWHDYLTDPTLADAICDRVLSRAHRLVLKGPSRRKDTPNQ